MSEKKTNEEVDSATLFGQHVEKLAALDRSELNKAAERAQIKNPTDQEDMDYKNNKQLAYHVATILTPDEIAEYVQ